MRLRWYNPTLQGFEWIEPPTNDAEAILLLSGLPETGKCIEVYCLWRFSLGIGIPASLIRVGETLAETGR